jgi:hypothetical protein
MKAVAIVSLGHVNASRLAALDMLPQFRKATANMKMATVALDTALERINLDSALLSEHLALFLGTGHGEFNTTLEFLKSWSEHRHARPFVFQNSLHNSTTGFVGMHAGLQAPSCTFSHHFFSGEDALDMAQQFLIGGVCEMAAVIGVDTRTVDHLPIMSDAGFPHAEWGQGAGSIILASLDFCKRQSLKPMGYLHSIASIPNLDNPTYYVAPGFPLNTFYDSHAVEEFARRVETGDQSTILLKKPNGGESRIVWTQHV